jgi:hypothetical protein
MRLVADVAAVNNRHNNLKVQMRRQTSRHLAVEDEAVHQQPRWPQD